MIVVKESIHLDREFLNEMIAHAKKEKPNEACGLLAGVGDRAVKLFRCTNIHESKTNRYTLDPRQLVEAMKELDTEEWELLAIYHSHPHSPAVPSKVDLELAYYPDSFYVIISLKDETPVTKAFKISDGQVQEAELRIV